MTNTLDDPDILCTFITDNPKCQYGVDGIVFDREGRLIIGNFGDGSLYRITLNEKGDKAVGNELWCRDPEHLLTTDGMTIDPYGNIYVADFSANAIARITPDGRVTRMACSPDTDGFLSPDIAAAHAFVVSGEALAAAEAGLGARLG